METYKQMKDRHQKEFNALPVAFAFSDKQYKEQLAAWNITEEEAAAGAVVGTGAGGFIRAEDKQLFIDTVERISAETSAAIDADTTGTGFIFQMFVEELANHEYSYTMDTAETLDALGLTPEDIENREPLRKGLELAIDYLEKCRDPFDN